MAGKTLVSDPNAIRFLDTISLESARRGMFGNHQDHLGTPIQNHVRWANEEVAEGVRKVLSLPDDPTRPSAPMRHAAARQIAQKVTGVLTAARDTMRSHSKWLQASATENIDTTFAPNPERATIQSEIRAWVRETGQKIDAPALIREAAKANPEVYAILHHSPGFLLGISEELRRNIVMDGIEQVLPEEYNRLQYSSKIDKMADAYDDHIWSINNSFYNNELANQASLRVEV